MNIRNFLSNMFSSSKKDRGDQSQLQKSARKAQDDLFVTLSSNQHQPPQQQQQQPDEDLLSNLRKSKLFFDDMDLPKSPPKKSLRKELAYADEVPSSNCTNNNNNNTTMNDNNNGNLASIPPNSSNSGMPVKRGGLVPLGVDSIHLTTPSKLERQEMLLYNQQRLNISDYCNSFKKPKKQSVDLPVQSSPAADAAGIAGASVPTNCIFFDRRTNNQQQHLYADEPMVNSVGGRSSVRSFIEESNSIEPADVSVSDVLGRIPTGRVSGFQSAQELSHVMQGFTMNHAGSAITISVAGQAIATNNSAIAPALNRSSSQSSSKSSRVRGSSSKKKAMFPESPISNCNASNNNFNSTINNTSSSLIKRADAMMVAEIPLTSVFGSTTAQQSAASSLPLAQDSSLREGGITTSQSRYQTNSMLVKEDVDGENEAAKAHDEAIRSSKMNDVEDAIDVMAADGRESDCGSVEGGYASSRKFYQECLSTRAEPPTQMKNRTNSFYFEETPAKASPNGVAAKQFQRSSSASNHSSKAMSIESPDRQMLADAANTSMDGVSTFNAGAAMGSAGNAKEINSAKSLSEYKSKSNGSSPSRTSLTSFHKQFELMVDKSEIPPSGFHMKSAQKVPSPIKEVEEVSQRNPIGRRSSRDMEVMELGDASEDVAPAGVHLSPKMRQKSVKFDYVQETPHGQNSTSGQSREAALEEAEQDEAYSHHHSRVHEKLQSRKPTPYNPFKQAPGSYLSRQNKFAKLEGEDAAAAVAGEEGIEDLEYGRVSPVEHSRTVLFKKNEEDDQDTQSVSSQSKQQNLSLRNEEDSNMRNNVFQASAPQQQKGSRNSRNSEDDGDVNAMSKAATTNKKPVKLPLALKKADFIAQMNAVAGSKKAVGSQSNGFVRSEAIAGSRSNGVSASVKRETTTTMAAKASGAQLASQQVKMVSTNKKKLAAEHQTGLSEFGTARIAHELGETASNPFPRGGLGGNQGVATAGTATKSAYKNCVFCQMELRLKDEFKILPCSHKSHIGCQPKEKNPRCPRCNSNNLSNKYRPKD